MRRRESNAAHIQFAIDEPGSARMMLADDRGAKVATVFDRWFDAGAFELELNESDLRAGMYYVRLTQASGTSIHRMIIVR